jgi:hypothetical protein
VLALPDLEAQWRVDAGRHLWTAEIDLSPARFAGFEVENLWMRVQSWPSACFETATITCRGGCTLLMLGGVCALGDAVMRLLRGSI